MRAIYVPSVLLVFLLVVSIWVNSSVQRDTGQWVYEVDSVIELLPDEAWTAVEERLISLYEKWDQRNAVLHMIMEHQDLDEAEKLFAGAFAACREQDSVELHILLEQLRTQILFLAETQQANAKNIL